MRARRRGQAEANAQNKRGDQTGCCLKFRDLKFLPTRESLAESNYGTMIGAPQGTIYQGTLADNHKLATTDFKLISCQFFTPPVDGTIIEYQGLNP